MKRRIYLKFETQIPVPQRKYNMHNTEALPHSADMATLPRGVYVLPIGSAYFSAALSPNHPLAFIVRHVRCPSSALRRKKSRKRFLRIALSLFLSVNKQSLEF